MTARIRRNRGLRRLAVVAAVIAAGGMAALAVSPAASAAVTRPAIHIPILPVPLPGSGPSPVSSLFGDCKTPPTPQLPGQGAAGWFEQPPSPLPPAGSWFGPHPTSTEFDQLGTAGLSWSVYDQGCKADPLNLVNSVNPDVDTEVGNWLLGAAKVLVAADGAVHTWASSSSWQRDLTPTIVSASHAVHQAIWTPWAVVVILLIVLFLLFRGMASDLPEVISAIAWALLVLTLVGGVTQYPQWASQQASGLMSGTLDALDAGFVGPAAQRQAASAHVSLLTQDVLFPAWARGELGSDTSATARRNAAPLLADQALTWPAAAQSPAQIKAAERSEEAAWKKLAASIQQSDPVAYNSLKGAAGGRIAAGVLGAFTAAVTCLFDILASLVVVVALLMVMGLAILLPGLAVVGIHPRMRHVIIGPASRVGGMLISAVMYATAAGVDARATGALLASPLSNSHSVPPPLAILLLAALPVALLMTIRRMRNGRIVPRGAKLAAEFLIGRKALSQGVASGTQQGLRSYHAGNHVHLHGPFGGAGGPGGPGPIWRPSYRPPHSPAGPALPPGAAPPGQPPPPGTGGSQLGPGPLPGPPPPLPGAAGAAAVRALPPGRPGNPGPGGGPGGAAPGHGSPGGSPGSAGGPARQPGGPGSAGSPGARAARRSPPARPGRTPDPLPSGRYHGDPGRYGDEVPEVQVTATYPPGRSPARPAQPSMAAAPAEEGRS